jgi:hypothetical protein
VAAFDRRCRSVLLALCVSGGAGEVGAQSPKPSVQVFHLTAENLPRPLSRLPMLLTEILGRKARDQGLRVVTVGATLGEACSKVGCDPVQTACLEKLARTLGAAELLSGSVVRGRKEATVKVTLTRFLSGAPPVSQTVSLHERGLRDLTGEFSVAVGPLLRGIRAVSRVADGVAAPASGPLVAQDLPVHEETSATPVTEVAIGGQGSSVDDPLTLDLAPIPVKPKRAKLATGAPAGGVETPPTDAAGRAGEPKILPATIAMPSASTAALAVRGAPPVASVAASAMSLAPSHAEVSRRAKPGEGWRVEQVSAHTWIAAGVGVAAAGAGAGLLAVASGIRDDVNRAPTATVADLEALAEMESAGRAWSRLGIGFLVGGGAIVAVAAVVAMLQGSGGLDGARGGLSFGVAPREGGAKVALEVTW